MSHSVFEIISDELLRDTFKDYGAKSVSAAEYELFLKEVVFEKLKGKRLGEAFSERFDIRDRVLSNYVSDELALDHIKRCKYIK